MSLIERWNNEVLPTVNNVWNDLFDNDFFNRNFKLASSVPPLNVSEDQKNYFVEIAVPGFKKEDIKVDLNNNLITISSEKKQESLEEGGDKKITRREFSYSSFTRSFQLPENVKREEISAECNDGILKLTLPKLHETITSDKKSIEIK